MLSNILKCIIFDFNLRWWIQQKIFFRWHVESNYVEKIWYLPIIIYECDIDSLLGVEDLVIKFV